MSDYNPTYTRQYRDYAAARKEQEAWHRRVARLKKKGMDTLEAIQKAGHMVKAPLITEVRPNPLSMELRIVLGYFWELYNTAQEAEAQAALEDACNLCHELFAVTSPHASFHIHSMYGCNNDDCPAWERGYEAAKEDVNEWYHPDC